MVAKDDVDAVIRNTTRYPFKSSLFDVFRFCSLVGGGLRTPKVGLEWHWSERRPQDGVVAASVSIALSFKVTVGISNELSLL